MNKYDLLLYQLSKTLSEIDKDKLNRLLSKTQYTPARKDFSNPVLRANPSETSFAEDNFQEGYKLIGWDALRETPYDRFLKGK